MEKLKVIWRRVLRIWEGLRCWCRSCLIRRMRRKKKWGMGLGVVNGWGGGVRLGIGCLAGWRVSRGIFFGLSGFNWGWGELEGERLYVCVK